MSENQFSRDGMAQWYARRHLDTDPAIQKVYYLPRGAPDREIRFVEINGLIAERNEDPLEAIDFGVDTGSESAHSLMVLDVTPDQWTMIKEGQLQLPQGWSLEDATPLPRS